MPGSADPDQTPATSSTPALDAAALSAALEAAVAAGLAGTVRVDARTRHGASGIVWQADLVLTADHVLERDEEVSVSSADGRSCAAQVVGRDPGLDLAVLRVSDLNGIPLPHAAPPRLGQLVLATSRGIAPGTALGILAEIGNTRRWRRGMFPGGYLRPDLTMYPGFSGGPLVDAQGALLGMNTTRFGGQALTVPLASLSSVTAQILAHGRLRHAWLGLRGHQADLPPDLATLARQPLGLVVIGVDRESPAADAGVQVGDILTSVGGQAIHDSDDLRLLLTSLPAGEVVRLALLRGGQQVHLDATLGER